MEPSRGERVTAETTVSGVVRGCPVDIPAVRSLYALLDTPRSVWSSPTTSIAAGGAVATLTAAGEDRFGDLQRATTHLFSNLQTPNSLPAGARPRLFGGFSFTDTSGAGGHTAGEADGEPGSLWEGYPSGRFVLPAVQVSVTSDGTWLTTAALGPESATEATTRLEHWQTRIESAVEDADTAFPGVDSQHRSPQFDEWERSVESVVERIRRGELRKVVLAQALSVSLDRELRVVDVLTRLGESYPSCYQFLLEPGDSAFFGATPERLVRVRGETVGTEALAGSIGRGETREEDEWLEGQLRDSEKNNHEHDLVVNAIRRQLEDVAEEIETGKQTVRKLANVQHLQTPIRATLDGERHVLAMVERLHPTPAVGGLPPEEARRTIRELEGFDRGWYAAPVGWIDEDGNGTFVVGIRSAVARERTATLFAGAGIVSDSDPNEEWDEIQLKFRPILDELG